MHAFNFFQQILSWNHIFGAPWFDGQSLITGVEDLHSFLGDFPRQERWLGHFIGWYCSLCFVSRTNSLLCRCSVIAGWSNLLEMPAGVTEAYDCSLAGLRPWLWSCGVTLIDQGHYTHSRAHSAFAFAKLRYIIFIVVWKLAKCIQYINRTTVKFLKTNLMMKLLFLFFPRCHVWTDKNRIGLILSHLSRTQGLGWSRG